jgi:hypothetical protein
VSNIESFGLGFAICLAVWAAVAIVKRYLFTLVDEEDAETLNYSELLFKYLDEIQHSLTNSAVTLAVIADTIKKEPAWIDAYFARIQDLMDLAVGGITAALGQAKQGVDYALLAKSLEPIQSAVFRIAADTELNKKQFDVLAKVMGVDGKGRYADYIDQNPTEETQSVFDEMVVQEMKTQGLSYSQAVDMVKSRMAHRSRKG